MASAQYTRFITKEDLKEPEHHELTKKEKRSNFWYYEKWHIAAIGAALLFVGMFAYEMLTQVKYDYTIGIITERVLPTGTVTALKRELEKVCDDQNGNGHVDVDVLEYNFNLTGDNVGDPNVHAANVTRLMGDIQVGQSMLFFTDNIEAVQETQMFLAYNDGTTPDEGVKPDYSKMGFKWTDSAMLTGMELGKYTTFDGIEAGNIQDIMKNFSLVKRAYYGTSIETKEKLQPYYKSNMALYDTLTQ